MSCDVQINSGCSVKERHRVMKCYWLHKHGYAHAHLCKCMYNNLNTVDGERFAGLNIRSFSAIKVFTEILMRCLGHKCSLFSKIKERRLYSWKNFCSTPENREKHECLAQ